MLVPHSFSAANDKCFKHGTWVAPCELSNVCVLTEYRAKICSSVVVNLLFYVPPIVCGGSVLFFDLVCITLCSLWFCYHLNEEERADCFAFIIFRMSSYFKCPVTLLHGAVDWDTF